MDALDKEALLNLSEQLSSLNTSNASKLLNDMQMILFKDANLDCGSVLDRLRGLLCESCSDLGLSKVKSSLITRQAEHKLLVLQVVSHLGEIFLSIAVGKEPSMRDFRKLDRFLLPRLFLTTSVSSKLLCEIALKSPLQILLNAYEKDSNVRCIFDRLETILVSWKTNYGCDFLFSHLRVPRNILKSPLAPVISEANNFSASTETSQRTKRSEAACAVWSANSSSHQSPHGSRLHLMKRNSAFFLNKRKRCYVPEQCSEIVPLALSKSADESIKSSLDTHFPLTDISSDSDDADSLAAFETPVKRRRTLPSLFVSPSPDRPNRF